MELDPLGTGFHLELHRTRNSFHSELGRSELIPLGTRALGSRALGSGALGSESQHLVDNIMSFMHWLLRFYRRAHKKYKVNFKECSI